VRATPIPVANGLRRFAVLAALLAACQWLPPTPTPPAQKAATIPIELNCGGIPLFSCLKVAGDAVRTVRDISPSETLWAVRVRRGGDGWVALFTNGKRRSAIYD
jgi:hypothetical protein